MKDADFQRNVCRSNSNRLQRIPFFHPHCKPTAKKHYGERLSGVFQERQSDRSLTRSCPAAKKWFPWGAAFVRRSKNLPQTKAKGFEFAGQSWIATSCTESGSSAFKKQSSARDKSTTTAEPPQYHPKLPNQRDTAFRRFRPWECQRMRHAPGTWVV